jgi:hypothetical protein
MNPMFYDKPVVLNVNEHAALRLKDEITAGFARNAVAVPLTLPEFALAARFYPICFSTETSQPLAVMGVKEGENLFVTESGAWKAGTYVPAYIRRYPFILAEATTDQVMLAMQDDAEVLNPDEGWNLFEEGKPSARALAALDFCRNYLAGVQATDAWVKAIGEAGLLVERKANFQPDVGEASSVRGFRTIDEAKLRALPDAVIGEWNRRDWLAPIFAHVQSMTQWPELFAESTRAAAEPKKPGKAKRGKLN